MGDIPSPSFLYKFPVTSGIREVLGFLHPQEWESQSHGLTGSWVVGIALWEPWCCNHCQVDILLKT